MVEAGSGRDRVDGAVDAFGTVEEHAKTDAIVVTVDEFAAYAFACFADASEDDGRIGPGFNIIGRVEIIVLPLPTCIWTTVDAIQVIDDNIHL